MFLCLSFPSHDCYSNHLLINPQPCTVLLVSKMDLDFSYLPEVWAPYISQAEDAEGQNQEHHAQNDGGTLVSAIPGLSFLLFPQLNLQKHSHNCTYVYMV